MEQNVFEAVFQNMPMPAFVVGRDVEIFSYNKKAKTDLLGRNAAAAINKKTGGVLHCMNSLETKKGCGHGAACKDCVIRNSVYEAFNGRSAFRKTTALEVKRGKKKVNMSVVLSAVRLNKDRALLMIEDITELLQLRELIPICASCKKIRNDSDVWERIEIYIGERTGTDFTHSICPDCLKKLYPGEK